MYQKIFLPTLLSVVLVCLAGCGGGGGSNSAAVPPGGIGTTTGTSTGSGGGGGGGGSATSPTSATVVNVAGGMVSGVDINVVTPAASPQANAELLGVGAVGGGGTAFNSGAVIHRGTTMTVLLFGAGLNGSMAVSISGPNDIAVSNIVAIKSTSGTPGVAFDAAVSGNAALGARTVALKSTNNDVTTFTGGLEVLP